MTKNPLLNVLFLRDGDSRNINVQISLQYKMRVKIGKRKGFEEHTYIRVVGVIVSSGLGRNLGRVILQEGIDAILHFSSLE